MHLGRAVAAQPTPNAATETCLSPCVTRRMQMFAMWLWRCTNYRFKSTHLVHNIHQARFTAWRNYQGISLVWVQDQGSRQLHKSLHSNCLAELNICLLYLKTYFGGLPAKMEILLVAPEHRWARLHNCFRHHVVQMDHLISTLIPDYDKHAAMSGLDAILYERPYSGVYLLPHLCRTRE